MNRRISSIAALGFVLTACHGAAFAAEVLGRGVIGLPRDGKVFLGWRLLPWDSADAMFNVYRGASPDGPFVRVSIQPVAGRTSYYDNSAVAGESYFYLVRAASIEGAEGTDSNIAKVTAGPSQDFIAVDLQPGADPGGVMQGVGISDLNGDAVLDFVLLTQSEDDPSSPCLLEAFLSGSGSWASAWRASTNFVTGLDRDGDTALAVWDLDGDARAEVVTRTGGAGDLTVLDGLDGSVRAKAQWRFCEGTALCAKVAFMSIALLEDTDGDRVADPFIVTQSGTGVGASHPRFAAFTFDGTTLAAVRDLFIPPLDADHEPVFDADHPWTGGLGTHGLPVADLDGDGRDEVIPCGAVLYGDWSGYDVALPGHSDICSPGDIDPDLPGPELLVGSGPPAVLVKLLPEGALREIWRLEADAHYDHGWHQGWCSDLTDLYPGMEWAGFAYEEDRCAGGPNEGNECGAAEDCPEGVCHSDRINATFSATQEVFGILPGNITTLGDCIPVDWTRGDQVKEVRAWPAGPNRPADVFGDSREEIISYSKGGTQLVIHSNIDGQIAARLTPLADRGYRGAVSRMGNSGGGGYPATWIAVKTNQPRTDIIPDTRCGDGVCDSSETCSSCAADCGACPDGGLDAGRDAGFPDDAGGADVGVEDGGPYKDSGTGQDSGNAADSGAGAEAGIFGDSGAPADSSDAAPAKVEAPEGSEGGCGCGTLRV
jgi:hypothetical protein